MKPLPVKLARPLGKDPVERIMADIPKPIFDYFFDKKKSVFTASRGPRQVLVQLFFDALHEECVKQGIPAEWHPENEMKVATIMSQIQFKPTPKPRAKRTKSK